MFAERFEPYHSEDTAWQQHHSTFNLQTLRRTDCQDFQNSGLETQPYCVQTDGLELVACYEDVHCWGPKDRFEKHCFRAYYAIVLRQERYAKDKWTTVLKLVRVTTRWGGIENVFTMNVHF